MATHRVDLAAGLGGISVGVDAGMAVITPDADADVEIGTTRRISHEEPVSLIHPAVQHSPAEPRLKID
jgi:hypothetical protein